MLGIVSFVLGLTIIGLVVAIPLAFVGLILGFIALTKAGGHAMAWWGIVLCALPFLLWVAGTVVGAFSN